MDVQSKLFAPDGGKTVQIGRMRAFFKVSADDTQGAYTVMEAVVPPDSGSGLHRHWSYDETAYVIGGQFDCQLEGRQRMLGAGDSVYWPRGAVHKFRCVGPQDGRIVFVCSPGKIFEDFIGQVTTSGVEGGTAVSGPAVDFRAVAARHGIEFLE
jgi:quercetin dioxygenase-like cupin family protein